MQTATFNNTFNFIANKRVLADRMLVTKNKQLYIEHGIYFDYNKNIIDNKFSMLIIGSMDIDNPYYGGFYLFNGQIPDQYPFLPPLVKTKTQGDNVRFHPNFYVNGKVCLSILGTWMGPPWTSCQNIGTISLSIKSLFIDNPITQEPGWEKCIPLKANLYKKIICYKNLEIAVYRVVKHGVHTIYAPYKQYIYDTFIQSYPFYIKILQTYIDVDTDVFVSPIYKISGVFKIRELLNKFKTLYEDINRIRGNFNNTVNLPDDVPDNININAIGHTVMNPLHNIKKKRKSPNDKAALYSVGYIRESENDNKKWIVIETKVGVKRWVRHTLK